MSNPASAVAHRMTLSRNGQVSIPAAARKRWQTRQMIVVDVGTHVLLRPALDDPVGELRGKYAGQGPSTDEIRRQERQAEAEREKRRRG